LPPPRSPAPAEGEYFDRLVGASGDFNPWSEHAWAVMARRFAEAIPPLTKVRLLDVGCGTGQSRQIYAPHCRAYVGADLSLGAVALGHARFPGGWLQADALRLPVADKSVDVVAFSSVLHHVPDRAAALAEAKRALRPGGRVFAFDPNLRHPAMALFRHPRSPLYRAEGVSPHERPLLPATLRRDFLAAGFTGVRQRCQSDLPYRAVAPRGLDALLPVYNRLDWLWEKSGMGRLCGSFVITWAYVAP
jgi:ubiquinone/menaquinone biosynthesis C-methylase UbiE